MGKKIILKFVIEKMKCCGECSGPREMKLQYNEEIYNETITDFYYSLARIVKPSV